MKTDTNRPKDTRILEKRWPCMDGEPIVAYLQVGKERLPYTAKMLERRAKRLQDESQALFDAL